MLEAADVTALGEDGSSDNYGLYNYSGASATLRTGSFTASGGSSAYGIYNAGSSTILEAMGVTALGEGKGTSYNYGLYNYSGAWAALHSGSFTARGGRETQVIYNAGSGTTLDATSVSALGESGSFRNRGLNNTGGALATLRGGSFTGQGGAYASGITNSDTLQATGVTALGEDGSTSRGLSNYGGASATLHGGSFTGRGGSYARGIFNNDSGTRLDATGITALGENGTSDNYGLVHWNGTMRLGVTQLVGGVESFGTLTCFQVYSGTFASYTCP
jgi:hypothetical protein